MGAMGKLEKVIVENMGSRELSIINSDELCPDCGNPALDTSNGLKVCSCCGEVVN